MKAAVMGSLLFYEETRKEQDKNLIRWDKKLRGTIRVGETELPMVIHLMCMEYGIKDPQGNWFLTIHVNATDIYKGVVDLGYAHSHCLRCEGAGCQDTVTDDYATPGDTQAAVIPVVVQALTLMGLRCQTKHKHRAHVYFTKKVRKIGKDEWDGNWVANKWRCSCPVHGAFTYKVETAGGE